MVFSSQDIDSINSIGIYKMWHVKSRHFYIGSTSYHRSEESSANGFFCRWSLHVSELKHKRHHTSQIQSLVDQFGIDGLRFSIIEICADKKMCREREQFWIAKLNPKFNVNKDVRGKVRLVYQFDADGDLINKFTSLTDASNETGIDRASINNCALGNRKSAGGFLWSYTLYPEIKAVRRIEQRTLDGILIRTFPTLQDVIRTLKLTSSTSIRSCFNGNQKQAYGFKWIDCGYSENFDHDIMPPI